MKRFLCGVAIHFVWFYLTGFSPVLALQTKSLETIQQVAANETVQPFDVATHASLAARDGFRITPAAPLPFVKLLVSLRAVSTNILFPGQLQHLLEELRLPGSGKSSQGDPGDQPASDQGQTANRALYSFFSMLCFAGLAVIVATFYETVKQFPPPLEQGECYIEDGRWNHGLLACFDDGRLCCFTVFCSPIRWADTMRMFGFLPFYTALALYLGLCLLDTFMFGVAGLALLFVLTYYRQKIRSAFHMESGTLISICEDCLVYLCCSCCAIVQEARQVELAWRAKHPKVWSAEVAEEARNKSPEEARKKAADEVARQRVAEAEAQEKAAEALRKKEVEEEEAREKADAAKSASSSKPAQATKEEDIDFDLYGSDSDAG